MRTTAILTARKPQPDKACAFTAMSFGQTKVAKNEHVGVMQTLMIGARAGLLPPLGVAVAASSFGQTNVKKMSRSRRAGPGYAGARCASYMPHSSRRTSQISPTVLRARNASRMGGSMFSRAACGLADTHERRCRRLGIPLGAQPCGPLELAALRGRVEPVQLDRFLLRLVELVDADDHALARLDLLLVPERRLLDLLLDEALLDRRDGTASLVDLLDQLGRALLQLVGELLDEVRAAQRIGGVGCRRPRPRGSAASGARCARRSPTAARAPRSKRSCAAIAPRRTRPRAPESPRGRRCSAAVAP